MVSKMVFHWMEMSGETSVCDLVFMDLDGRGGIVDAVTGVGTLARKDSHSWVSMSLLWFDIGRMLVLGLTVLVGGWVNVLAELSTTEATKLSQSSLSLSDMLVLVTRSLKAQDCFI